MNKPETLSTEQEKIFPLSLQKHVLYNKFGRTKVGRNEQCPCGSGKKFKKCCILVQ